MCKKEKYEKHRNVLVSFFAFAMLVVLNSQKLSLRTNGIGRGCFFLFALYKCGELCYNYFRCFGETGATPVRARRREAHASSRCYRGLTLLPQRRGHGHWETEKADL